MPSPRPLVVGVRSQDTKSVCILTEDTDAFLIQQVVPKRYCLLSSAGYINRLYQIIGLWGLSSTEGLGLLPCGR